MMLLNKEKKGGNKIMHNENSIQTCICNCVGFSIATNSYGTMLPKATAHGEGMFNNCYVIKLTNFAS